MFVKCRSKYNKTLVGYPFLQSEAFTLIRLYRYTQKRNKRNVESKKSVGRILGNLFAFGGMRVQEVRTPLGQVAGVEMKRLFDALLPDWHFALRAPRYVDWLLRVTVVDGGHAWPRP